MSAQLKLIDQGIISHEPGRGAYMPGILVLPDGTFLGWQHVGSGLAAVDSRIELLRSTDSGSTWRPGNQKAAALFSSDQGRTWGQFTIVADDTTGKVLWWDQMSDILPDGRLYTMFWTHKYGTSDDLNNHWATSQDQGRTWSQPRPTNLRGQVCAPIALPDGRVAAIYNYRHEPQGIHVALTEDLQTFDLDNELVVFDAGAEATLGQPDHENYLAEHLLIGFGKPGGRLLPDGDLLTYFWCTSGGVTHTRWVRLRV